MIRFNNDYNHGAFESILNELTATNTVSYAGYSEDDWCDKAENIENTGHKILALPNTDGKITAQQVATCAAKYYDKGTPEYLTEPKMVYLSFI